MWQVADIAFVVPVCVFLGYGLSKFLKANYGLDYSTYLIMGFALLGFIITIVRIKRFVDIQEQKEKELKNQEKNISP